MTVLLAIAAVWIAVIPAVVFGAALLWGKVAQRRHLERLGSRPGPTAKLVPLRTRSDASPLLPGV